MPWTTCDKLRHCTEIQAFTEVVKAVSPFKEDLEGPVTSVTDNIVLSKVKLRYINLPYFFRT
jgi:vacuolar-type H+-ATPase catalytic subunit A/Vma1